MRVLKSLLFAAALSVTPIVGLGHVSAQAGSSDCSPAPTVQAVFVGMVTSIEDGVVRYQIQQVRTGSLGGYAVDNFVDVYYRDDAAFLKKSIRYLVGANPDPLTNQLSSKVREATPLFGGADIAGLDSAGNACPQYEDPVRTLNVDGSSVESGTLKPLMDAKGRIVGSIAVAVVVVFAGLFGLVIVKRSIYRASRATTKRRRQQMHSRVSR